MKELTPKSIMSKIRRNKDKEIYLLPNTASMLRYNMGGQELKRYEFVVVDMEVTYLGKRRRLGRIDVILEYDEDDVACWYEKPRKSNGMIVL